MFEYTDASGQIYTEDQINKMAAEQKTSASAIIKSKGLKRKSSKTSTVTKQTKKTYPWSNQEEKKQEPGFLSNFKKSVQKPKATKTVIAKEPTTVMSSAQSQIFLDELTSSLYQTQVPQPFSMETEAFKKAKTKKAEEKKEAERVEKVKWEAKIGELDLKYNDEAFKANNEATKASLLTDEENVYFDNIIKKELSKNGIKVPSVTSYDEYGNPLTDIANQKPYIAFEKQRKIVIKKLKVDGLLDEYNDQEIAEEAAKLWKDQEVTKLREDKYREYLKNNTNLSEKAKNIITNYQIKKANAESEEIVESGIIRNDLIKRQEDIVKKVATIDTKLKPKDYKFVNQQEVDKQNKLIKERNELVGFYIDNEKLDKSLEKTIASKSKNIKGLGLAYDMFKRDYSTTGSLERRFIKLKSWMNDFALAGTYLADVGINLSISSIPGNDEFKINPLTEAFADNAARYSDALSNDFEKDINGPGTVGDILKHTGDLILDFAPDLVAMLYTGGGSAVTKKLAKETTEELVKKSLLSRVGSALTISKETAPITARVAGSKYGEMVNEQRFGYYDQEGNKIMPNYNTTQLMLVPATYAYMEGLGEKVTANIVKRNFGFFKAAKEAQPDEWWKFGKVFFNKLDLDGKYKYLKKSGKELLRAQAEEQPAEFLTYLGQDLADKFLLGKDVNLLENTGTVFKDTGLLTLALTGIPVVGGLMIKPFMSKSTADKMVSGAARIAEIDRALAAEDLTEIQKVKLEKEKAKVASYMQKAISTTVENIGDMPVSVYTSINSAATKIASIANQAEEINNSDIDANKKKADLEVLKEEYVNERYKLNTLTRSIESINTFGKPINSIVRGELMALQLQRVEINFDNTLSDNERKGMIKGIEKKIEDIYAENDINITEERTKEYVQNLKVAQKLAASANVQIIEGNSSDELLAKAKTMFSEKTITAKDLDEVIAMVNGKAEGLFLNDGKFLFIDKARAIENKAVTVGSHEFLHKLLEKTLQNAETQINLGSALRDYLVKSNPDLFLNDKVIGRLIANYGDSSEGIRNEELLTIFSDALLKGDIKYNESFFTKLGDIIRRFLQDLGVVNIKFNSGADVFNFIRDYNNTIAKGKELNKAQKRLLERGAKGELVSKEGKTPVSESKESKSIEERMDALDSQLENNEIDYDTYEKKMIALEKEEAELKRKEYEEQKAGLGKEPEKKEAKPKQPKSKEDIEISEVAAKAKAKLDAIGNDPKGFDPGNPTIYSELDKMVKVKSRNWRTNKGTVIDFTNKDKGGLDGFDMDEMTSYVRTSMIPYIAKFDPSKNNSLYGYINAQYINRMRAALKSGEVANVVFTEDVTEMTKLANEDVEVTKPSLPERKRFQNILESGVFSPDVIENIQAKILPVVRTLKSKINEKTSLNKTVVPIIAEIRDEMGKQADIDIKKAMGGKENQELQNWLIVNKKTILENMTTTWLMGKDQGDKVLGGMPFAIQKRVNGRWLNYPEWVGKKIDRESVDVDLAGRTAGHEMVRRLPEVDKNVSTTEFLSSIIDLETGNPIRGRKEALAKVLAEEVSFDIISDDIANDGIIAQALNRNQELKGAITERIIVEEFNRLAERGNIKFSLTEKELTDGISYLIEKSSFNAAMIERKGEYNPFKALYNKLITNGFTEDELEELFTKYNDALDKIGHYKHEKFIGGIIKSRLSKNYIYKLFGGNNNYNPDALISEGKSLKNIKTDNALKVIIEIKKDIFARMTSATLNIVRTKYSGTDWGKKIIEEYNNFKETNLFKQIGDYLINETESGGYKIKDVEGLKALLKGKKTIFKIDLSIDSVKDINKNKAFSNDLLVIGTSLTDYFGADFLEKYEITDTDIITAQAELKIEENGYLRPRVYFYINGKVAKDIDKIASKLSLKDVNNKVNAVIKRKRSSMHSKSLENNLNSFNKDNKGITIVSDYITANNIKRIDAETSFDVLNDLNKSIEEWWGILEDKTIDGMVSSVDYAFDVIEDRENEGGPLMEAVNNALNLETIKFAEKQLNEWINNDPKWKARPKFSKSLDYEFNDMLERNKAVPSYEKFSDVVAKRKGEKVNNLSFFVPPSADDFRGLTTYMFSGKGKQGELDQQFFDQNLVIPYVKGINALDSVRQSIKREYKALLSEFPDIKSKLEKLTPDKQFTYDQAIRVYLWNKNNIEIPGLNRRDKNKLVYLVKTDSNLLSFAEALSIAGRQDGGWMEPSVTWDSETIISDLHNITEGDGRKQWLAEFIENANAIFSTENLNKIQAIYGTNVKVAIEDALYRMKNGKNRPEGTDALTNRWMNWINGSTAAIMFFNVRSAILQTISSINYLNWNDNNPLMAAKAFANQKQYWTDFAMIINSDKMRERRAGLKADVTQAEIANAANSAKNKARGILSYLQKIGFTPTQAADSFSIAIGGAAFYRNRVNTYLKQADEDGNLINTEKEAEDKAWLDFSMISDQSMQSADPLYISKQQTTSLGRLVLAFANTPLQYNRLIKKAALDLANKRGDRKTNLSKIIYYGALQNFIFSALQSALFLPFEDEEEEVLAKMSEEQRAEYDKLKKKQEDKTINILNGMADTVLRGSGITGALISTIKNAIMEYNKQEQREMFADHAYTILAVAGISPPISSKARKLYGVHRIKKFEKDVIEERGWEITRDGRLNLSPNYSIVGNIAVATTNVPLDRLVEKIDNVSEALDSRNTKLQRAALMLGWKEWELNVKNEENELIKAAAKVKRKEEGIIKAVETRAKKKKEREEALDKMTPEEREIFYAKEAEIKSKKGSAKDKILDAMTPEEREIYYETGVFPKKKKRKMGGD